MLNIHDRQPFAHLTGSLTNTNAVFLGDANHAVCPFAGNGANLALMDGWDLAEQLCKHNTLESGLKAFDELMVPRSKSVIKMSHSNIYFAHMTGWKVPFIIWFFRTFIRFLI